MGGLWSGRWEGEGVDGVGGGLGGEACLTTLQ